MSRLDISNSLQGSLYVQIDLTPDELMNCMEITKYKKRSNVMSGYCLMY